MPLLVIRGLGGGGGGTGGSIHFLGGGVPQDYETLIPNQTKINYVS